jgi:adenylylsulfate kinase-like enzyme/SAM-dependent methyltransferase
MTGMPFLKEVPLTGGDARGAFAPGVIWITGFSGAGKTTVARKVKHLLDQAGAPVVFLDGDDLRSIFAGRWGYTREDRIELGLSYFRLCHHLAAQGVVVVISAVAMYDKVRHWVRRNIPNYIEVFLNVPTDVLLDRDARTKKLYSKIPDLMAMYDVPEGPHLSVDNFGEVTPDRVAEWIVGQYGTQASHGNDKGRAEYWNSYYESAEVTMAPSPFALFVEEKLSGRAKLVDVGCGNGRDAIQFAKRHDVTGIDTSKAAVRLCQQRHGESGATFQTGSLPDQPRGWAASYDAVYSRFVLHAMTESEEVAMLEAADRVLRPGGRLFIECRSINDPLARQGEVISPTERIAGHYRRFIILEELRQRLLEAGFRIDFEVEAAGLAVFGDEDPIVIRVIASKAKAVS